MVEHFFVEAEGYETRGTHWITDGKKYKAVATWVMTQYTDLRDFLKDIELFITVKKELPWIQSKAEFKLFKEIINADSTK